MALHFAASTVQYANHGSAASLDDMNPVTMMAWIVAENAVEAMGLIGKNAGGEGSTGLQWQIHEDNFAMICDRHSPNTACFAEAALSSFAAWGNDKWLFVACTINFGVNIPRFLMGDLTTPPIEPSAYDDQVAGSGSISSDVAEDLRVGHAFDTGNSAAGFFGDVAWVHIVNAELTNDQIREQWMRPHVLPSSRLFCHYGWNGTGVQPDWSGSFNNGTLTGSPTVVSHVPLVGGFGFDLPVLPSAAVAAILGIADFSLPSLSITGIGDGTIRGIADFNLPVISITGVGDVAIDGIADFNLPVISITGVGDIPIAGVADFALPNLTITGVGIGAVTRTGIADFDLPLLGVTGVGRVAVDGTADFNLPIITITGIGDLPIAGIADFNLPNLAITGIGDLPIAGIADFNLPNLAITGIGDLPIVGTADFNLPSLTIPAVGDILIKGVADFALPNLGLSATGIVGAISAVDGVADFNLPSLWVNTQGGVDIPMVNIFSTSGQTGAETGTAFTLQRKAGAWFINRDVLAQVILGSGSATIHVEVSLDGGSTFADIVSSVTASTIHAFNLPPIIRVRLSAATAATVNVWLDADLVVTRVNS